jgi:hypothetical protein
MRKEITLTEKQTEAWDYIFDDTTTELGYGGGARGGKSYLGCLTIIAFGFKYPETRWLIGRRELKNLKRTTLMTFFKVMKDLGRKKDIDFVYNQVDSIIKFQNGTEILLFDLKNQPSDPLFTSLGSLELTGGFIDESNEVPEMAIETVKTRIGNCKNTEYGIKPFLLETFNPNKGHVYTQYWKPFKNNTLPKHRKFVRALITDNPYVEKDYIRQLENSNEVTKQRLLYGNFDYSDDPMVLMTYEKITDIFSNDFVEGGKIYCVIDVAGRGKDKTVVAVFCGMRLIYIFYEEVTDQDILFPKINEILLNFKIPKSNVIVDYDGIGVGLGDRLKCKKFQGASSPIGKTKEEEEKMKSIYFNLRSQCYFHLSDIVNANEIYIEEKRSDVIEYIQEELSCIKEINDGFDRKKQIIPKGSISSDGTKETIKSLLGRSPDFADVLMMRMWFEFYKEKTFNIY